MKNIDYMEIADRIIAARKNKKISQQSLAEYADISTRRMSDIENGNLNVNFSTLINISKALDLSLDYLVYGNDESALANVPPSVIKMFNSDDKKEADTFFEYYEMFKKIKNIK